MKWNEAWERARPMLDDIARSRAPSSESGVDLAYLDWGGRGELIVLHHANGFCAATYAPIAHALRDRYRVISIDARGHGDSTSVDVSSHPDAYSWERMAADYSVALLHILDVTGHDRIRLAIGHSFGGILTLAAAAECPGLIEEALLLDPVVLPPVAKRVEWMDRGPDLAGMARRRRAIYSSRAEAYAHFAGRSLFRDFPPHVLALYVAEGMSPRPDGGIGLKCAPEVEAAVFEGGRSMDVFEMASTVETTTRIVHATRGNFSLDVYDDLARRMPRAKVESCEAGHLFAMEHPEFVLARI